MAQVVCPSFSGAAVLRATKLDGCCKPIFENRENPGNSGQVTTDAFVNIAVSPGTANDGALTGEQQQVAKADGQVCFTTVSCPTPANYGIAIELCALDPQLVLIMKPDWCPVRDSAGTIIGFTGVSHAGCAVSGFALEVWMNVYSGAQAACRVTAGGSRYGYMLFPCITGVQIGQWTIANGPITFSFTGTTRRSSGWGKGPYNVLFDGTKPTPLPCPVRPNADFVQFVTTFPPPEAECGVQPVDGGIPDPPEILIRRGPSPTGCTVEITADNHAHGPVIVRWGDGAETELREGQVGTHTYRNCGDPDQEPVPHAITVCDKDFPQICTTHDIVVPLPADEPVIDCVQDPSDDSGRSVLVDVALPPQAWCGTPDPETVACACPGESPIGAWGLRVDWGEEGGDDRLQYVAVNDDCRIVLRHTYTTDGRYSVKVCRNDNPTFCARCTFIAGGLRPDVQFISWDSNCTATINVENNNRGPVTIDWGDGTPPQTGVPEGRVTHSYTAGLGQSYTIMVCSEAPEGGCRTLTSPVCTGTGQNLITVTATCDPEDPTGHRFLITADNLGHGTVVVEAPTGQLDDPNNAGDGTDISRVTFIDNGIHTITAYDPDEPERFGSATVAVPCTPAAEATAVCDPDDNHHVTITTGPTVTYPITVQWGDGVTETFQQGQTVEHHYYRTGDRLQPERPTTLLLGRSVNLTDGTVHQQADYDNTAGEVYATQVMGGGRQLPGENAAISHDDRVRYGHLTVSRVSSTGTTLSGMFLIGALPGPAAGFDHGSGLGVERVGSTVYLWTGVDPVIGSGPGVNAYATRIARFPYRAGAVLRSNETDTSLLQKFDPFPDSNRLTPSIDHQNNRIAIRHRDPANQWHVVVYTLTDFKAGNFDNPVYNCTVTDVDEGQFQSWTVFGKYLYTNYGFGDAPTESKFVVTDISGPTGNVVARIPNNQYPDLVYRESEAIFVIAGAPGPRLVWGFAIGAPGDRQMNLYATAPHLDSQPVQIVITDSAGDVINVTGVTEIPCTPEPPQNQPPTVEVEPCPSNRNRVSISYANPNGRGVRVFWTANDTTTHPATSGVIDSPRDYSPGTYTIRVQDIEDPTAFTTVTVCVPCGQLQAEITCPFTAPPVGFTAQLRVQCANHPVTVNWGDSNSQTVTPDPNTNSFTVRHTYAAQQTYEITLSDVNNPGVSAGTITIPCTPPAGTP